MPEVIPYFLNNIAYPDTTYEPPFVFFGDVGALKFTIYCTQDADFGFEWAVDTQYEVITIDTFQALAGVENSITVPVTARYGRVFVRNINAVPSNLKVQIFFLNDFSSESGSEDITLSSAGGISLIANDIPPDYTLKGLTEGSNITIIDNGNNLEISAAGVAPYKQVGSNISPISNSTNAISSGVNNVLNSCITSLIGGSSSCTLNGSRTTNSAIIGARNSKIVSSSSNGDGKQCVIIGSSDGNIGNISEAGTNNGIYSSSTGKIANRGTNCVIIGSNNSKIPSQSIQTGIYSSSNSTLLGERINESIIMSSSQCFVRAGGASDGGSCTIVGSSACQIGLSGSQSAGNYCGIYSSLNSENTGRNQTNAIIAGNNSRIIGNNADNSVVMGSNGNISHIGNFMFSDSAGGNALSSNGNNRFNVRSVGGARFLTNTNNTVGVSLASGGNSWASVCDVNTKENLQVINSTNNQMIVDNFYNLPVYKYNYIGNPEEQICFGPTAQDWNMSYGCDNISIPICTLERDIDNNLVEVNVLDDNGDCQFETKPAKDPLKIEIMDMIGVMMICINDLQSRIKLLENPII